MRRLLLVALLPLACSRERNAREPTASSASASQGADPLILRVPRNGGTARIYKYPRLDSVISASASVPAINRILAFDEDAGSIAFIDAKGQPARIDLRLDESHVATKAKLTSISSADGSNIYGVTSKGEVIRLEPSGATWTYRPKSPPRVLLAEPDGGVIIGYGDGEQTIIARLHPPDTVIADSAKLPLIGRAVRTQVGDRAYFTSDAGLVGVKTRGLALIPLIPFKSRVHALAPTPSGDRLYVTTIADPSISVVDRYTGKVVSQLKVSAPPIDLRMDPLGRYLLARQPAFDSAWVIAIGSNRVVGAVATKWTPDLPAVAPDGSLALLGLKDVSFVDGESLKTIRVAPNGAKDFWYFFTWDGFRPRGQGVDEPVTFGTDSTSANTASSTASSTPVSPAPRTDSATPAVKPPPTAVPGYVVSFAAVLSESAARSLATQITVNGVTAHVASVPRGTATIYRVLLGPFATRDEAERIGKLSGRSYWIYEASP